MPQAWLGSGIVKSKTSGRVLVTVKPVIYKDCFQLVILDEDYEKHSLCVSERVFDDAMVDHHINLTKEYH